MSEKYDDTPTFDYEGMIVIGDLALKLKIEHDQKSEADAHQDEELLTDPDN